MRIAWLDLLFSWPARGGADVDVYYVLREMQALGQDVKLFGACIEDCGERGLFEPDSLPFPAERLSFSEEAFTPEKIVARFQDAVNAFAPDLVVIGDAFFLKPHLMHAFQGFPTAARFYAHELICHRDILRYREDAPCPQHYLRTPDTCRACAYDHLKPKLQQGISDAWTREYAVTKAYAPAYYDLLRDALSTVANTIVSNPDMATSFSDYCPETTVIPGGVDLTLFEVTPPPDDLKKVIYLPGRAEDPSKGLGVLLETGERLCRERDDFIVRATMPWQSGMPSWFESLPWTSFEEHVQQYQQADICVIPSLWEEPFGLTAVEAMAAARPVCASRAGGLKTIIQDEDTGLLFTPGDTDGLAGCLTRLLDALEMRQRLGAAGRARVETTYSWRNIVELHYMPLLTRLYQQTG